MLGIKTKGIQKEHWKPLKKAIAESPVLSRFKVMKMEDSVILTEGDCSILIRHNPDLNYYDIICFLDTVESLRERFGTDSDEEAYFRLQDTIPGVSFMFNDTGMVMVRGIVLLPDDDIADRCIVRLTENCAHAHRMLTQRQEEASEETVASLKKTLEDTFVQHQTMNNGSMPTVMTKLSPCSYEVEENNLKNVISCDAVGKGFNSVTSMERITDSEEEGTLFERYMKRFSDLACPSVGMDRKGRLFYGIHIDQSRMDGPEIIYSALYNQMETSMARFAMKAKTKAEASR